MWIKKIKYFSAEEKNTIWVKREHGSFDKSETVLSKRWIWVSYQKKLKFLLFFSKEISKIFQSGIPIIQGIESLKSNNDNYFNWVIQQIIIELHNGEMLSKAMENHMQLFGSEFINVIKSGEESGSLDIVSEKLSRHINWKLKNYEFLKKSVSQYILLSSIVFSMITFILITVVPAINKTMLNLEIEIPWHSEILFEISNNFEYVAIFVFILAIALFKEKTQKILFRIAIKSKIIKSIYKNYYQNIYFNNLSVSYSAGVPLITAFKNISEQKIFSKYWLNKFKQIYIETNQGRSFVHSFSQHLELSNNMKIAIQCAEKTGKIEDTLIDISQDLNDSLKDRIEKMYSLISPAIMLFLASILIWIILSTIIPLYAMIGVGR